MTGTRGNKSSLHVDLKDLDHEKNLVLEEAQSDTQPNINCDQADKLDLLAIFYY